MRTAGDHVQGRITGRANSDNGNDSEPSAKTVLAIKLNELIDQRGLSQGEAAQITGLTQSRVSQVRHRKLRNISLERLMQALVSLDQRVEILVRPAKRAQAASIAVNS